MERIACLVAQVQHAIDAGVDVIQVRERDLEAKAVLALTSELVARTRGTRTRVLVNDRLDIALAARADGVHLRGDSISVGMARSLAPRGFVVGCSVHGVEEAREAASGADYLIAGTIWPTASKQGGPALLGTDGLANVVSAVRIPVLAIGGVTVERAAAIAATGAEGVAAIGLFMAFGSSPAGGGTCRAAALGEIVASVRGAFGIT